MSMAQSRLEIAIDVFDEKTRRASILPQLTAGELIEAIVQEFRSIIYLSDAPEGYSLMRARDQTLLQRTLPLGQQLKVGERLVLVENEDPLSEGTQRPTMPAYLCDEVSGKVYKLYWCPAIIGRPDKDLPHNERIAVNLAEHERGLRVSRRHAQITQHAGHFLIESLSTNQTIIKDLQGHETPLTDQSVPLEHGHLVVLEKSQIALKFVVRGAGRQP